MKNSKGLVVLALIASMLGGCDGPKRPPNNGGNGETTSWSGICKVRPVVITNSGNTRWTNARVAKYTQWLNPAYIKSGLSFQILPRITMEKPEWFTIDTKDEFYQMAEESMHRSSQGELAVFFVDSIPVWSAGGVAMLPSNSPGRFQHGIAMAINSSQVALVHEVGHAFNLPHSWSDSFTDTPTRDSKDCTSDPCNAMSYCGDRRIPQGSCFGNTFSPQQMGEVAKWSIFLPRKQVVVSKNVPPGVSPGRYTDNKDPVVD